MTNTPSFHVGLLYFGKLAKQPRALCVATYKDKRFAVVQYVARIRTVLYYACNLLHGQDGLCIPQQRPEEGCQEWNCSELVPMRRGNVELGATVGFGGFALDIPADLGDLACG